MKSKDNFPLHILISVTILTVIITWFYWPVLSKMISYLSTNDDYSYGLIIPLVSGYIIYQKWPKIKETTWQPCWWGILVIMGGLGLNLMGELAADLFVPRVSFIITLGGILILLGGWRLTRLLIFPLFLLLLMIPLPELISNKLTLPLQLISSQLATGFLQLVGIPVFRQGNIIDMGVRQMQIVNACSGLRYILALLALGVIFCYFFQRKPWKIIVLLLILLPATIFANALRVAAMGIYPILLLGFWHAFSGWLIFIFCFIVLAAVNYSLDRLSPPEEYKISGTDLKPSATIAMATPEKKTTFWIYVVAATFIIFLFIPITQRASYAPNYPLKEGFENFPMAIDSWKGRHVYIDPELVAVTQSHAHLNAEYVSPEKNVVTLWIAYYESQKKAGGFVHSPKGCFVASGWQIEESKVISIGGEPVNWLLVNRMGEKLLIYYWFMQRGRWIADETKNKFYMAYDGFWRRRTDGAIIRLITPISGNIETAQERLTLFAQNIKPLLEKFIPN
jgi:exosortase D (VPLPA-CTERM-specific)